ncbi:unnamed protein product, partial [Didymodactylos carnosus]
PWAFEAREFLRVKLVGREICYTNAFDIPNSGRTVCTMFLGKDVNTGENIAESLLSEGLVELRPQTGARANDVKYQRLTIIDQQAKLQKKGRHSSDSPSNHIRDIKWTLDNPKAFVDAEKNQMPIDAVVEFVRDGSTVRCLLLRSHHLVTVMLTGIKCPQLKREGAGGSDVSEPYAEEAKQFVETRLLQREVKIRLEGVNNQNLVGTVLHPKGNIALHLLKEGLAKCSDWSIALLSAENREQYRITEKYAKENRLRIWTKYVAPIHATFENENNGDTYSNTTDGKLNDPTLKGYQAKVTEISNADSLTVRKQDGSIKKIYLSSVRAPRAVDLIKPGEDAQQKQIKRPLYDIPYLFEAREYLRKRLIGKTVRVVQDYVQPAANEYPEKVCCTVYIGNVNIGEALISKGLAKALRHRQDDEARSSKFDDLITAEQQAEKKQVGLFSQNSASSGGIRIIDLTGETNKERAKQSLSVFQRTGRMEGIVEFIASGSRFRIHLIKDNRIISFLLSSISCPKAERRIPPTANQPQRIEQAEPYGQEALAFSREHFLQRDVFVEIDSCDRGGNFLGRMTTADGQSAALMLVQNGFASLHETAYNNASNYKQLQEAEEICKKNRIGIWSTYEEPTTKEGDDEAEDEANQEQAVQEQGDISNNFSDPRYRHVQVTYVSLDLKIYVQYAEDGSKLERLQQELRDTFSQQQPTGGHMPKKNEVLAARFTDDNEWYRARIEKIEQNKISVYFVDYGNRETITDTSRLTLLPPGLKQLPDQAHEFELAYIKPSPDEEDRLEAKHVLSEEINNEDCLLKIEYRYQNVGFISLYKESTKDNLGKLLLERGLVMVNQPKRQQKQQRYSSQIIDDYIQAETLAKTKRLNIWQYGDMQEDDAAEFGYTGKR